MKALYILLILSLLIPGAAVAKSRPWISVNAGWGAYEMSDINDWIDAANEYSGGEYLDRVEDGMCYGILLGNRFRGGFSLGVGYEMLDGGMDYADPGGSLKLELPAHVFKVFAEVPLGRRVRISPFLSFEAGAIASGGKFSATVNDVYDSVTYDGRSSYAAALFGVEIPLNGVLALRGQAGYRQAEITKLEFEGRVALNDDGSRLSFDYSGFLLRVAIRCDLSALAEI